MKAAHAHKLSALAALVALAVAGTAQGEEARSFFDHETELQQTLATAAPDSKTAAARSLADFYAGRGLYVEALAAMETISRDATGDDARLFMAQADYSLGRYRAVAERLSDERLDGVATAQALRGMALARLGAWREAASLLAGPPPADLWPSLVGAFYLAKAETALAAGDRAGAEQALGDAASGPVPAVNGEPGYLRARLAFAAGGDGADAGLRAVAASGAEPYASRAMLALLMDAHAAGRIGEAAALDEARALTLRWRGGAFERESLDAICALARTRAPAHAFDACRRLVDWSPEADAATLARRTLTEMLIALGERDDLAPGETAQLFYENLDFAPPGREGDRLIRDVARRLAALDLLEAAAELLDHQVTERLRGPERSALAADLAALYLKDRRPSAALRVLGATRLAGLDDALNRRRTLLEAEALSRKGAIDSALALLEGADGEQALTIKADLLWRLEDWAGAGAAWRALAMKAEPRSPALRASALRAAAAFLKAGDSRSFGELGRWAASALSGSPEADIIRMLGEGEPLGPAFMDVYRRAFAAPGAEG